MTSVSLVSLRATSRVDEGSEIRTLIRTPSPSPSEHAALTDYAKFQRAALFRKDNIKYAVTITVVLTLIILLLVYKDDLVTVLTPAAEWMYNTPGGWLIPIAGLIVLSIPPLLGHEVIMLLVGYTWGIGIGFGIASAGVLIGEVIMFYIFKSCCGTRGKRLERESLSYATLTRVLHDGGLRTAIVARWSAIPPHLLTAVLAISGINIWIFCTAAVVSLPRQAALVFIGFTLRSSDDPHTEQVKNAVDYSILAVKIIITLLAAYYIRVQERKILPQVVYERRKRRQERQQGTAQYITFGNAEGLGPTPAQSTISISERKDHDGVQLERA